MLKALGLVSSTVGQGDVRWELSGTTSLEMSTVSRIDFPFTGGLLGNSRNLDPSGWEREGC